MGYSWKCNALPLISCRYNLRSSKCYTEVESRQMSRDGYSRNISHHVGSTLVLHPEMFHEDLLSIQADGDELDAIQSRYPNLCAVGERVQCFYGDIAKMMLKNCFDLELNEDAEEY